MLIGYMAIITILKMKIPSENYIETNKFVVPPIDDG